jgi:hypothetical protein
MTNLCYSFPAKSCWLGIGNEVPEWSNVRNDAGDAKQRRKRAMTKFRQVGIILSQVERSCAGMLRMLLDEWRSNYMKRRAYFFRSSIVNGEIALSTTFAVWPVAFSEA